jgi:uncharacterized protein YggU (UPF0235/DUF167 family)
MATLAIRVTSRSAKPGIGRWRQGTDGREELELRVSEVPADCAANEAVVRLLAVALGLPRSQVFLVSGQTSRHKRVALPLEINEIRRRIEGKST